MSWCSFAARAVVRSRGQMAATASARAEAGMSHDDRPSGIAVVSLAERIWLLTAPVLAVVRIPASGSASPEFRAYQVRRPLRREGSSRDESGSLGGS